MYQNSSPQARPLHNCPGSHYIDVGKLDWQPAQMPGVMIKPLWQDEGGGGASAALFRLDPGARLPRHRHPRVEQTFVLEGSLVDAEGTCTDRPDSGKGSGSCRFKSLCWPGRSRSSGRMISRSRPRS